MFKLNQRLREDTVEVTGLSLSLALLMKDRSLPWLILVPQREGIREIHELSKKDRALLIEEAAAASRIIESLFKPDKINVGALGNLVPQFHLHVIGRFKDDRAWPGPIWGKGEMVPYPQEELDSTRARLEEAFKRYPNL